MLKRYYAVAILAVFIQSPAVAAEETGQYKLDTITVTAEKRDENVQKVTNAITVVSDMTIEDAGISTTREIQQYVPNLSTSHGGTRGYFSRIGMRGLSNTGMGDPAVALYIDGIPYTDIYLYDNSLFDIERIEVLKGPQGSLYGKNAEAGVINIVTKKPGDDLHFKVGLQAGDFSTFGIQGSANVPLVAEKVYSRFSLLASSRDGYVKNVVTDDEIGGQQTLLGRGSFLITPSDALTIDCIFEASRFDDDKGFASAPVNKQQYRAATGMKVDDFEIGYNYQGDSHVDNISSALKVAYEMESVEFVSVTGYRNNDADTLLDGDFSPLPYFVGFNRRTNNTLSQELRLQSKEYAQLKWLVGLFYSHEDIDNETGYMYDSYYAQYMQVPFLIEDNMAAELTNQDAGIFSQGSYRFFDGLFGVTAGLRYENSTREMDRTHTLGTQAIAPPMEGLKKEYEKLLPKLALDWQVGDDIMVYTSYGRGYKAGGFSYAVDELARVEYDPEISDAYELGVKSEFSDLGLRFNLASFYNDVKDYQDRVQVSPITIIQDNATNVEIYGLELESELALSESIDISAIFGYTHARYGKYIIPTFDGIGQQTGSVNFEDNVVPFIPEYNVGLFINYRHPLGIMGRFEINNNSESYLDRANDAEQSSYTLFNVKVGYETENWDVYLLVRNITNEEYFQEAFKDPNLGYIGMTGDPRTVTAQFNYRF